MSSLQSRASPDNIDAIGGSVKPPWRAKGVGAEVRDGATYLYKHKAVIVQQNQIRRKRGNYNIRRNTRPKRNQLLVTRQLV